jgi:hypothetical protein
VTDTEDTNPTTPEPHAAAPARRWRLVTGLAVAIAVLAVGVAAFAVTRVNDDQESTATQQVAAARQACQQWLDSGDGPPGNGPGDAWCDDMAAWMTDHMPDGQMLMGGSMMWDSPQTMRDVCVQAMGTGRTGVDDPTQGCDEMVGWISDRMGNWDDWRDHWGD